MARIVFDTILKDPESARITYHPLQKGWVCSGVDDPGVFCWKMPVTVNAKNAFGGYTGSQTGWFWFNNTQMLMAWDGDGRPIYTMPVEERVSGKAAAPQKYWVHPEASSSERFEVRCASFRESDAVDPGPHQA